MEQMLLLAAAGLLAGAMNAAAGGGSFVSLPALILAGVPSVAANASSTVALLPGAVTSSWAFRREIRPFEGVSIPLLLGLSLAGGGLGALLLLWTPQRAFDAAVPWLLLLGTLAFAFGPRLGAALRRVVHIGPATLIATQVVLSIYGGYFGGAVGIMMMATWSLLGITDLRAMNAAKTLLVGACNVIAAACFILAQAVWWPQTLVMLAAAALGGYLGAVIALRIPPARLRLAISILNFAVTGAFFIRRFG